MSDDWQHHETDAGAELPPDGFLKSHRLGEPARTRALEAARLALGQRPAAEVASRRRLRQAVLAGAAAVLVGLLAVALREPRPDSRMAARISGDPASRVMSLRIVRTDATVRAPYRLSISYRPPVEAEEQEDPR